MRPPSDQLIPQCTFFFNDTATTEIYTLSLHDALPIWLAAHVPRHQRPNLAVAHAPPPTRDSAPPPGTSRCGRAAPRSEEHTSELQSRLHLVCRLLLEKKKHHPTRPRHAHHRPPL